MAALTINNVVDAGTKPTYVTPTASTGDTVDIGDGGNTFVHVKNASGSPITVTVTAPGNTSYGQPQPDPAITVAATTGEAWIPIRRAYDPGDGSNAATIVCSSVTSVTIAAVRVS